MSACRRREQLIGPTDVTRSRSPQALLTCNRPPASPWVHPRREQLIGLTDVTRSHFDKLVDEFEKGLDEALKEYDGQSSARALKGCVCEA